MSTPSLGVRHTGVSLNSVTFCQYLQDGVLLRDTITEGKHTRRASDHSCATSPRFPTPKRGPQSAANPHRQRSRRNTALSLTSHIKGTYQPSRSMFMRRRGEAFACTASSSSNALSIFTFHLSFHFYLETCVA